MDTYPFTRSTLCVRSFATLLCTLGFSIRYSCSRSIFIDLSTPARERRASLLAGHSQLPESASYKSSFREVVLRQLLSSGSGIVVCRDPLFLSPVGSIDSVGVFVVGFLSADAQINMVHPCVWRVHRHVPGPTGVHCIYKVRGRSDSIDPLEDTVVEIARIRREAGDVLFAWPRRAP